MEAMTSVEKAWQEKLLLSTRAKVTSPGNSMVFYATVVEIQEHHKYYVSVILQILDRFSFLISSHLCIKGENLFFINYMSSDPGLPLCGGQHLILAL